MYKSERVCDPAGRASRLLHMGVRVEDAMDFEKDLVVHEEDYNIRRF